MTLYVFDTTKRDAAIANFALDMATTGAGTVPMTCPNADGGTTIIYGTIPANDMAKMLRRFFDAPTSQKLIAQKVGTATGLTGDTPSNPMPPRDSP